MTVIHRFIIQFQVNAHVNLLHSRSESDLENEVEVDRYAHYEVARPPSSYNTTMTSSSTPHLLMGENTMTRTAQNFYHQVKNKATQIDCN